MSKSTATNDPLYHDVSPEYERYTKFFLMLSGLVCFTGIICAVIKAQDEKRFYVVIISLVVAIFFVVCIYTFFKRRILLAEKLWFVNLTIFVLFLQALIYLIFVFVKPYPIPPPTTPITTRFTPTHTSTPHNTSNTTGNATSTTRTTPTSTTTKKFAKQSIPVKLYELNGTRNIF